MSTPTSQNSCTFTNNCTAPTGSNANPASWDGSVCVISGFNSTSDNSLTGYEQQLTLLQFSDGSTVLASGKSNTLMLDQLIPGTQNPMLAYNLLISQPNYLFPVAAVGEMADLLSGVFPAITIPGASPQDSGTGINAFIFLQNLQAYPGSNMAQQFTTALNNAGGANSGGDLDAAMASFFANTVSFKDVTFNAYVAAQSYVTAFAFAWANFQPSYTYYVYTTGQATGSTGSGGTVAELGTITLTQTPPSGIPSLSDPSGGYTIIFTPSSGSPVTLSFSKGQVLSGGDVPQVCLQGLYMDKSYATGNQTDYGSIISSLAGTVFGQQAIATEYQQDLSSSQPSGLQSFLSSSGWQLTMGIMNITMGVKALAEMVGWVRSKLTGQASGNGQGSNPDAAARQQQAQNNVQENQAQLQNANPDAQVPPVPQLSAAQEQVQNQVVEQNNAQQKQELENEENAEAGEVHDQVAMGNNPNVQEEASNLRANSEEVKKIDPSDSNAGNELAAAQKDNSGIQSEIDTQNQSIEKNLSGEAEQKFKESANEADEAVEEKQNEEKQEEEDEQNEESGEDGEESGMVDDL